MNTYILYKTAHIIIWCKKKDEILPQYEFIKEIALSWIDKKTANLEENDKNNNRGRDDITRSSSGSSLGARGSKKCKDKKATHLNEKTLDPVGGALRCWIDTSLHHLPDENLNHLKKRSLRCGLHRWANRKAELIKI